MNLGDLQGRIYRRLGEDPANPQWWTLAECNAAINWAQRIFVLLTLCLEDQRTLDLTPGQPFYHMLAEPQFTDWFLPLRVRLKNKVETGKSSLFQDFDPGAPLFNARLLNSPAVTPTPKLRPSRLADLDAESSTWTTDVGVPSRYCHLKSDLLCVNRTGAVNTTQQLVITFAMVPQKLVQLADIPAIPESDHQSLADMAIVLMRLKDGGQELAKTKTLLTSFIANASKRAAAVRARSIAQQYDNVPFEIERYDLSRNFMKRSDLPPARQEES